MNSLTMSNNIPLHFPLPPQFRNEIEVAREEVGDLIATIIMLEPNWRNDNNLREYIQRFGNNSIFWFRASDDLLVQTNQLINNEIQRRGGNTSGLREIRQRVYENAFIHLVNHLDEVVNIGNSLLSDLQERVETGNITDASSVSTQSNQSMISGSNQSSQGFIMPQQFANFIEQEQAQNMMPVDVEEDLTDESSVEGFGIKKNKQNKWINFVKSFASKHNMPYTKALKDPRCKALYHKVI